jgi:O-antigen ligase
MHRDLSKIIRAAPAALRISGAKVGGVPHRTASKAARQPWIWVLILIPIIAIPVENQYTFFTFGLGRLTIIPLLIGVLCTRFQIWVRMIKHPIFLTGLGFLAWAAFIEILHSSPDMELLIRVFQMLLFATFVAAALTNERSFQGVLTGIAIVSSLVAIYLIGSFYSSVNIRVTDFRAADQLRSDVFVDMLLEENLNKIGWTAAMGAVIAFSRFFTVKSYGKRLFWVAVYLTCAVGAAVPLSRGALIGVFSCSGLILLREFRKTKRGGIVILSIVLVGTIFALVPDAVLTRLTSSATLEGVDDSRAETRKKIYTVAYDSISDYWAFGVGAGNYSSWGERRGLTLKGNKPVPRPHNGFLAAWIYFGLPGLLLLVLTCVVAGRKFMLSSNTLSESNALFGLLVLCVLWLVASHVLYNKEFGLILGLVMWLSLRKRAKSVRHLPLRTRQRIRKSLERVPVQNDSPGLVQVSDGAL